MNGVTKSLDEFYNLTDAEDYFNFFELTYNERLVNAKRFHILREYGELIKTGLNQIKEEEKLLDYLKFSLLRVYSDFENGHAPSAADVWDMYKDGKLRGCAGCTSSKEGGHCDC